MKRKTRFGAPVILLCLLMLGSSQPAGAQLTHPSALFNLSDLNRMKANRNIDPWKAGYISFTNSYAASISYTMKGPFGQVWREPDRNRGQFESDMTAIYAQAVMWYMTSNSAYATKAIQMINAWGTTHTNWSGSTWSGLLRGDYGQYLAVGTEILRYTYPGWTSANTTTANNYLLNMFWNPNPASTNWIWGDTSWEAANPGWTPDTIYLGAGNQGIACLKGWMADAIALNDSTKFNDCVSIFESSNCVSIARNSLTTGQDAESGRDQAHSMKEIEDLAIIAEMASKQNVSLYSYLGNRNLALMEYWCSYNLGNTVPYSPFSPCYTGNYNSISGTDRYTKFPTIGIQLIYADAARRGLFAPFTTQYRNMTPIDSSVFLFDQDNIPGTPIAPAGLMISGGNSTAILSWSPALGAVTYNVKRATVEGGSYTTIASGIASPNLVYVDSTLSNGTTYYYVVSATSSTESANSGAVSVTPAALSLTDVEINGATPAGSSSISGGTWTITGGGSDLGNGESYHYTCKPMTGDGSITARLTSGTGGKIGLTLRNDLTNTYAASANIIIDWTATGGPAVRTSQRSAGDGNMYWGSQVTASAPQWLSIQRHGSTFHFYFSSNGTTWTDLGSVSPTGMGYSIYAGMCVCSRSTTATKTGVFDSVTIGSGNTPIYVADGIYSIKNRADSLTLDNLSSTANGSSVGQWSFNGTNSQRFLVSTTGGYRKLMCIYGNMFVDSLAHTGNGSLVGQWANSTSGNQQWTIQDAGGGYFRILNRANGLCIDNGAQTTNGAPMVFWSSNPSSNQQWQFLTP